VTLENPFAAAGGGEVAFVLDDFTRVVHEDASEGEVGVDFGVEREQRTTRTGHVRGVLEQAVPVGVMHRDGGGRGAELFADLVEDRLHGRADFGVLERGDVRLKFGPEYIGIFGGSLDEIGHEGRAGELFGAQRLGAQQAGRKTILIIIHARFDADDAAFLHRGKKFEARAVAENVGVDAAGFVAEFDDEERVAVLGRLAVDAADEEHAGKSIAAVAGESFGFANGDGRWDVGHGGGGRRRSEEREVGSEEQGSKQHGG